MASRDQKFIKSLGRNTQNKNTKINKLKRDFASFRNRSNQLSYTTLGKILGKIRVLIIFLIKNQYVAIRFDSGPRQVSMLSYFSNSL